jgi:hypothetical protein
MLVTGVTLALNEKNFEAESFSIFCLEAIGLQYKMIFPERSFQDVGRLIFIQQFYLCLF